MLVLTDIGADVDDQQSLVRLLLYSNEIDIEGLVATTSTFQRDRVQPNLIRERLVAYRQVRTNLLVHAPGYPRAETLLGLVRSGSTAYGMSGVGAGRDTAGSRLIVRQADRRDPRPLWISIWGGAADLAQALWTVRAMRSPAEVARFVSRLRIYAISDQDDAGPWIRNTFPQIVWLGTLQDVSRAGSAAWIGLSAPVGGSNTTVVSRPWLAANIRSRGPLGAVYPEPRFLMEGDTPAFLHLVPNGLNAPAHPDWGSWGGRFARRSPTEGGWADAADTVTGVDGRSYTTVQAAIWRWRSAYQNDMASRIDWSIAPESGQANHPPVVQLNGIRGDLPVIVAACPARPVRLSAAGSRDPDGQRLSYRWWWYPEPGGAPRPSVTLSRTDGNDTEVTVAPAAMATGPVSAHIILEAVDSGTPALTRYRRAVISVRGNCPSIAAVEHENPAPLSR